MTPPGRGAGGKFLIRLGESLVARRAEAMPGDAEEDERLRLIPADPTYAPCCAEDVHILGKVEWVVRRVGTPAPSSRMMLRSSCPPSGRRHGGVRAGGVPPYGTHINALRPLSDSGGYPTDNVEIFCSLLKLLQLFTFSNLILDSHIEKCNQTGNGKIIQTIAHSNRRVSVGIRWGGRPRPRPKTGSCPSRIPGLSRGARRKRRCA